MHWRRKWQPAPVFLPGESQGWRSLVGCHQWGRTESDTTEAAAAAAAAISILNSGLCPAGIFSVLSLASECTTLAAELPKVSYVKALDVWLIACLLFGFASLVEYAVVQVMLNNPKRVEAEKARIAKAEQADGKGGNMAKRTLLMAQAHLFTSAPCR